MRVQIIGYGEKEDIVVASQISTGAIHHATLTVTDVARAREFYTSVLGFEVAGEFGPRVILSNGGALLAIGPPTDPGRAISGDSFNENRVGLDHLCFSVGSRDELVRAMGVLDEHNVSHGEILDLSGLSIYVLMFRDPDNLQIELTAPHS